MRWIRKAIGAGVVLSAAYAYFAALHPLEQVAKHEYFSSSGPWVIAHRGGRGLWPENTLTAMESASALGADVLEMDLRATADGVLVLMHDATVDRTTEGSGRVDAMSFEAIRRLDAGYRFQDSAGQFSYRGKGVKVPAFEEVLARMERSRMNLEMKSFGPELAARLCGLLKAHSAVGQVLVAASDQEPVAAFRKACPEAATGVTMREGLTLYTLHRMHLMSLYRGPAAALETPDVFRGDRVVDGRLMAEAREMNLRVLVFTVNEEAEMKRLLELGVQGIVTDYPDRLLRLLNRRSDGAYTPQQ